MNKLLKQKNYGNWDSIVSAKALADKSTRLGQIQLIDNDIYWLESRPQEKGRGVIVCHDGENKKDITPEKFSVRTRVHEYGGGDFWGNNGQLIFANDNDQRLYLQDLVSNRTKVISPKAPHKHAWRYADGDIAPSKDFTICVREIHSKDGTALDVVNELVRVDLATGELETIVQGADFYSNPRISLNGSQICWLSWNHPNMPWDATELWLADLDVEGNLSQPRKIAGGKTGSGQAISVYNPQWSAQGELFYVADNNGWWHIYNASQPTAPVHQFAEMEFGLAQWIFATNSFQIVGNQLITIGAKQGRQALYQIDLTSGVIEELCERWTAFNGQFVVNQKHLFFMAANPEKSQSLFRLDLGSGQATNLLEDKQLLSLEQISTGKHYSFATTGGAQAHGYFYPPVNPDFHSTDELPPLIVMSHGGPTAMTDNGLNLAIQFWTSRGFAVADVNYRGSSGYGREYRDSLKGQWGIYDVDDCIAMAEYLAELGLVDGKRLVIRGGSAGGFTTLCALTFHNKFKVGMSRYGVADLESLAKDSHKFEIRYLDSVVGKLPEDLAIYKARSPSEHTDKLSCPILLLQGLDDKVVPPSQSEAMVKALEAKGLAYQYITFAGEGHGFRKPETIIQAFEAELEFYRKYLL